MTRSFQRRADMTLSPDTLNLWTIICRFPEQIYMKIGLMLGIPIINGITAAQAQ